MLESYPFHEECMLTSNICWPTDSSRAHSEASKDIWLSGWMGMVSGSLWRLVHKSWSRCTTGGTDTSEKTAEQWAHNVTPCLLNRDATNAYDTLVMLNELMQVRRSNLAQSARYQLSGPVRVFPPKAWIRANEEESTCRAVNFNNFDADYSGCYVFF